MLFGHIDSKAKAERAVHALRQRQHQREAGATEDAGVDMAAWYWGLQRAEYLQRADVWPLNPRGELFAMAQIESPEAVRNVEEIAQVPGVGALFFGPSDYGRTIGKPSQLPSVAPETEAAIQTMLRACLKYKIPCGYPVAGPPDRHAADLRSARPRDSGS